MPDETVQSSGDQGQTTETQTTTPAAPTGPWHQDIEAVFTDPQIRSEVDAFLRSKIQPRVTQLEQQVATAEDARNLWQAFQTDPAATYAAITNELYGEEAGQAALAALEAAIKETPAATAQATQTQAAEPVRDPRLDELYSAYENARAEELYAQEIQRIVDDPANADVNPNLLHPFVAAAEGDFDKAVALYRGFATDFQVTKVEQTEGAPAVLGSDAGGTTSVTPTEKHYDSLDDAINDFFTTRRQNSEAPPVA